MGEVSKTMGRMRGLDWHPVEPVGLGDEWHARDDGMLAGALFFGGTLLHASMSFQRTGYGAKTS